MKNLTLKFKNLFFSSLVRILSQTTPENTCKNFSLCSIDPSTRYPTLNLKLVLPFQVED